MLKLIRDGGVWTLGKNTQEASVDDWRHYLEHDQYKAKGTPLPLPPPPPPLPPPPLLRIGPHHLRAASCRQATPAGAWVFSNLPGSTGGETVGTGAWSLL